MQPAKPADPRPIGVTEALRDPRVATARRVMADGTEKSAEDLLIEKPVTRVLQRDNIDWEALWNEGDVA